MFSLFLSIFLSCLGGSQPQLPPAQSGRVRVLLRLIRLVYQLSLKEKKKIYQLCIKSVSQVEENVHFLTTAQSGRVRVLLRLIRLTILLIY